MSNLEIELKEMPSKMEGKEKTSDNEFSPVSIKVVSGVEVSAPTTPVPEVPVDTGTLTANQLAINLMKCIAGTGSLAIPYGMWSVGIILGILFFGIIAVLYVVSAYHLISTYYRSLQVETPQIHTDNDYARLCYITMGMPGYIIFNIANVVTLIGMASGTMIVMTDFLSSLPLPIENPTLKRGIFQTILTILCLLFCLLKDPSLLVGISSFGLVALIISLIILFVYGVIEYGFKFDSSFWFPRPNSILNNLGVFINSLAFSLMCLSQVKHLKKQYHKSITKTISLSVFSMAIIYIFIGIIFLSLYKTENGVPGNILAAIPSESIWNMIISVLMVVTCMGSFPLYLSPIHELFDGRLGKITTGKYFITSGSHVLFRVIEVIAISVFAFFFNDFKSVLNFNILFISLFLQMIS